jgi:ribonuclease HI
VITTSEGEPVAEHSERIGVATNNVAEYRAMIRGIELARAEGATELELVGDSELIVKQVQGAYKVKKDDLKPLHAAVHGELSELDEWSIRHVRREHNARADELVNEALDA